MSNVKFVLICLFFPVLVVFWLGWIIYWKFWDKKQTVREQKRKEQQKKLLAHIYNFPPVRLKNRTWRKSIGRKPKKSKKPAKTRKNNQS